MVLQAALASELCRWADHEEVWMSDYETIGESEALYLDACVLPKIDIEAAGEDARLTRILVYSSTIPVYSSFVAFRRIFQRGW